MGRSTTDDLCLNGKTWWSCGLQARAALHNTVANRSLSCEPRSLSPYVSIAAACRLDAKGAWPGGDVAHPLAQHGWVRPVPDSSAAFAADTANARAERTRLWLRGWPIFTP